MGESKLREEALLTDEEIKEDIMKVCKDSRIWGQNNKEAGDHLGTLAL